MNQTGVSSADASEPFNGTVTVTVGPWSGMMNLEDPLIWQPVNGGESRQTPDIGPIPGRLGMSFVGTGYTLNGLCGWDEGAGPDKDLPSPATSKLRTTQTPEEPVLKEFDNNAKDSIGSASDLGLAAYNVEVIHAPTAQLTFDNATIEIPVRTQAPNLTMWQTQATLTSVVANSSLSPNFTTELSQDVDELRLVGQQYAYYWDLTFPNSTAEPKASVVDDYILLSNGTEIVYNVPENTSLLHVLGPVGEHSNWEALAHYYSALQPRPSWWIKGGFPVSQQAKPENKTGESLFWLPIDPTVKYTLRIGALGNENTCAVSGIQTFPFHFDYAAGQETKAPHASRTPVIVGSVVGVVGGLALLALVAWFLYRRHRRRAAAGRELLPEPYTHDASTAQSSASLRKGEGLQPSSTQEGGPFNSHGTSFADSNSLLDAPIGGRREVTGSEIVDFLPPQYREDWQLESGSPLPSGTVVSGGQPGPTASLRDASSLAGGRAHTLKA